MNGTLKTTLLVPTLNEVEAAPKIMPQIDPKWVDEILVIDGGSTDGTIEYMQSRGIKVYSQTQRGYGTGMLQGLHVAQGEIVIEFTPDGNSIAEAIPKLIDKINEGYDLVIASRYAEGAKSEDDDWLTGIGNWMFTTIVNILFGARYTDVLVAFRAYRKSKALTLDLDAPGLSWPCQISDRFAAAGFKVTEIPVDEPARIGGERKMRPFRTGSEIVWVILTDFAWRLSRIFKGPRRS